MSIEVAANHLSGILANFPGISLVYLFGSQVTGATGPMSDYDLAIFEDSQGRNASTQIDFQHAFALALKTSRVDVISLHRAPIELAYAIISSGKCLYQRDILTRVEYEARVLSQYGDYLPVLRSQKEQILLGAKDDKRIQRYREALGRTQRTLGEARTLQSKR